MINNMNTQEMNNFLPIPVFPIDNNYLQSLNYGTPFDDEIELGFGSSTNEEHYSEKPSSIYDNDFYGKQPKVEKALPSTEEDPFAMESTLDFDKLDLNKYVEQIIDAKPIQGLIEEGVEIDKATLEQLRMNKRKRKTKDQLNVLMAEYKRRQNWTKEDMKELASRLNMSLSQVYKWQWDQKKKDKKEQAPRTKKDKKTS